MKYNYKMLLFFLLTTCFAFVFLKAPGTGDLEKFTIWTDMLGKYDIVPGYIQYIMDGRDYPPLFFVLLSIPSKISSIFRIDTFTTLKVSIFLFLVLTSISFYVLTGNIFITILLQLSLTLVSTALGYVDIYFAPFLILSLYALKERKLVLFSILFPVSFLIKWQPLIIAPFLFAYVININSFRDIGKINLRLLLLQVILPVLFILIFMLLIFGKSFPLSFKQTVTGMHAEYLSGNALNLNWIITYFLHLLFPAKVGYLIDGKITYIMTGSLKVILLPKLIFFGMYSFIFISFFKCRKSFQNLILYSLLGYLSYFIFYTGVHENHLFIPCILAAVLYCMDGKYLSSFVIWNLVSNINMFVFYGIDGRGLPFSRVIGGIDTTIFLSAVNVLLFIVFFMEEIFLKKD